MGLTFSSLFSCGEIAPIQEMRLLDSLNQKAYEYRYKNLDTVFYYSSNAYQKANLYQQGKAEAANNLGFYSFMKMDFEAAESFHKEVFSLTSNELECLIADVGLMKIYQRTSMNKEFYDFRNSAINRLKRIYEDITVFVDPHEKQRVGYAISEFYIVSSIYYYYLQQRPEAVAAINQVNVDDRFIQDTAQWLYYQYIKGSAGLCGNDNLSDFIVCEFDNLYSVWRTSVRDNYIYFEANSLQGLAELLNGQMASEILYDRRSQALRQLNPEHYPDSVLPLHLARRALNRFKKYDDIYQIAGAYRTIGSWLNEHGHYREAIDTLTNALNYVNKHHELYYDCPDSVDRLKSYAELDTLYTELFWINQEGIKTVPEWIARIREQLSIAYAGLGMKEASDYNRNIYLDILDYTRQDKELESRYAALEIESRELNLLMIIVIVGIIFLIPLFWFFNKRWEKKNQEDIELLRRTLEICQKITASLPSDSNDSGEIINSVLESILPELTSFLDIRYLRIALWDSESEEMDYFQLEDIDNSEEDVLNYIQSDFNLSVPDKNRPIGILEIYTTHKLSKDEIAAMKVISPYIAWVIENGLTFISLGDERRRLEKELYVHEQHIIENKRQNLVKRACMSIVVGINPFIDRIINEINKLREKNYAKDEKIKKEKFQYIDELITKINEYNDILALWIKMKQGTLSLNIENFQLNDLFDVIAKGRKTFEMKQQTFNVEPIDVVIKADKSLTLFMINTLTENARKYTSKGGHISLYAREDNDYVEISVQDDGRGLSPQDVSRILEEKIYDSSQIGIDSKEDVEELFSNKGSGFGLMNCKGIIEKYKKTSPIFKVCVFGIDSQLGVGSRFFFRLPKGIRKSIGIILCFIISSFYISCSDPVPRENINTYFETFDSESFINERDSGKLLIEASLYADTAYFCNVEKNYAMAIQYVDLSMARLNEYYKLHQEPPYQYMQLVGIGTAAEIKWWNQSFDTDFHIILDIRNEASVAFLALKNWDAYRYNNRAYTTLYKLLGEDISLAEYCRQLENSTNNKIVSIILCIIIVIIFLAGYYTFYLRRRFINRRNLEEVLEINSEVFAASLVRTSDEEDNIIIPHRIIGKIYDSVNELLIIDAIAIAVYNEDTRKLNIEFNPSEFENQEEFMEMIKSCFDSEKYISSIDSTTQCFPLLVDVGNTHKCVGVWGFVKKVGTVQESDRILSELIARFIAIVVYNAVIKLANKYRDIESVLDETRRASREDGMIHVQNMVLDNCLSTIKHETIYYPNKIKQIIDKLNSAQLTIEEETENINTIGELISYYKDIYVILSSCASRQLDEVTFRRKNIPVMELVEYAQKYFFKISKRMTQNIKLEADSSTLSITGDIILLRLMMESLINEAMNYPHDGKLGLRILPDGDFVRFFFIDRRRNKSVEELNQLFYPSLSAISMTEDGRLNGTEYLICKQIIRDHDEYAGRRGCRINAEPAVDGGFLVYFTLPRR